LIHGVVIHLLSEQPAVADLFEVPAPGDTNLVGTNLVGTNLRTLDGRRPVFVDDIASTFIFPYRHIRFLEIRPERRATMGGKGNAAETEAAEATPVPDADLEIDEDFLRRIREA
jgi:hypothetical protein